MYSKSILTTLLFYIVLCCSLMLKSFKLFFHLINLHSTNHNDKADKNLNFFPWRISFSGLSWVILLSSNQGCSWDTHRIVPKPLLHCLGWVSETLKVKLLQSEFLSTLDQVFINDISVLWSVHLPLNPDRWAASSRKSPGCSKLLPLKNYGGHCALRDLWCSRKCYL